MIASSAALTTGGTRSAVCSLRARKRPGTIVRFLAFNEAPGAQLVAPVKTIGIVAVAALAAKADGSPPIVIMTATCWGTTTEQSDHRHRLLLRARRERPRCRRASEQSDQ